MRLGNFEFEIVKNAEVTDENMKPTLAYLFQASAVGRKVEGAPTEIDELLDQVLTVNAGSENPVYNLNDVRLSESAYKLRNMSIA